MKKALGIGILLAGLVMTGADQYKSVDTKDKLKDKDLMAEIMAAPGKKEIYDILKR